MTLATLTTCHTIGLNALYIDISVFYLGEYCFRFSPNYHENDYFRLISNYSILVYLTGTAADGLTLCMLGIFS